uniref:Translation initiation factor eIF2B subunit gamma n=1 Tax=Glossina brevipalpis TaxID=37001 RepID=A0A1A9W9Q5_9MUSC
MMTQEFQAVVLAAGRGSRLPEVLGDTPKSLLTVGPYPLLWYPLNLLQQHGFQEAIVIILENEKSEIQLALEHTPLKLKLDFVCIPSESDFGTADSLRYIQDKIKVDFLVLSCDLITSANLFPLINIFRQHDATLAILLFRGGFEPDVTLPGPKSKQRAERDLIGINPDTKRLLFFAAASDFEETVNINAHLLRKYEKMTVYSRLVDGHVYVMKKWTTELLKKVGKKEHFSTLKGEFLPYIVKKQMAKADKTNPIPAMISDSQSELGLNHTAEDNIFSFIPDANLKQQVLKSTLYNDNLSKPLYNGDPLRCYAIEAAKDTLGLRVNTTLNYFAINQKISSIWPLLCAGQDLALISSGAVVNSTQTKEISAAESAKLSEKTSLNFSVFGPNCCIKSKNIVNKSLIMANAIVEEGCNIENCIIGPKAVVKTGAKLKNCLVGANYIVEENSILNSKHLTHADDFMEIDIQ